MTVLDDRPTVRPEPQAVRSAPTSMSSLPVWRLASRLARRDVRRRPGRTILVMLLVAVPVVAMTAASVVARTSAETAEESFARRHGAADLVIFGGRAGDVVTQPGRAGASLPDGSTPVQFLEAYTPVRALVDGELVAPWVRLLDIDLTEPVTDGMVAVTAGRAPSDAGEVLLAPKLAADLGVGVGDRLELVRPDLDLVVVGLGEDQSWVENTLMVAPDLDRSIFRPDRLSVQTLVDLPDTLSTVERDDLVDDLVRQGVGLGSPEILMYGDEDVDPRALAWGWVAGVLAFVAVGIVIAAAFATTARRHLVTVGQLAANGASPRVVRRTMALQGAWTGLFGAGLGISVGVVGSVAAHRNDLFDRFAGRPVGALHIAALDLLVIAATAVVAATVAASIPARSAARVPVLSALAGRRPVGRPPTWLAPFGGAIFVGGLLLLAAAASVDGGGDLVAAVAVLGGLGVIFGMVCASPLIVAGVASAGARLGGATRLAARSLGRSRARSAGVLTAIAVVGAAATIASVAVANARQSDQRDDIDARTVEVYFASGFFDLGQSTVPDDGIVDEPPTFAPELPDDIRAQIEAIVPGADWTPITEVVFDPPAYDIETGGFVDPTAGWGVRAVVVDEGLQRLAGFDDEQLTVLEDSGVLVTSPWFGDQIELATLDGPIPVDVSAARALIDVGPNSDQTDLDAFSREQPSGQQIAEVFVSAAFVEENGLSTTIGRYRLTSPTEITRDQSNELNGIQALYQDDAFVESATDPASPLADVDVENAWLASGWFPGTTLPWDLIQLAVIVASLLGVLAVVAIGLSLAATESRDERDVLRAVGAAPSTLRRVAATKAWVLTSGAAVVAVPVGYVTVFVITRAIGDSNMTAPFPFVVAGALLVAIPACAWLATLATSGLAQRLRPATATPTE